MKPSQSVIEFKKRLGVPVDGLTPRSAISLPYEFF